MSQEERNTINRLRKELRIARNQKNEARLFVPKMERKVLFAQTGREIAEANERQLIAQDLETQTQNVYLSSALRSMTNAHTSSENRVRVLEEENYRMRQELKELRLKVVELTPLASDQQEAVNNA